MAASGGDPLAELAAAQALADRAASAEAERVMAAASSQVQGWSPEIVQHLAWLVVGFTALALVLGTALLWRKQAIANDVLKVFGIVTIVGMSALLLVVGYSDEQLTPIVGLFGAIAGYLLGKDGGRPER